MNLLNPGLAFLLAPLLVLPVFIHFLNKRFPERFNFSSVEHLRKSAAERSRLYRWRHRILAIVRTIFLLLLLYVFLKPVIDRYGNAAARQGRRVLLVIDHSMSMEYRPGGMTSRTRAIIEARKILGTLGGNDTVDIIAAGSTPELCTSDFSDDVAHAGHYLDTLGPGIGRAALSQANAAAARLLSSPDATGVAEIYYITNFQRKNWAEVDFQPLANLAHLFFVDVGADSAANHAIIGAEMNQAQVLAGDAAPLVVTVGNYSDQPLDAPVTLRVDQHEELRAQVSAGPWSTAKVALAVPMGGPGLHVGEVSLPGDDLPLDDRWLLTWQVREKEEVVTISAEADPTRDPVRYLHAALNPFPRQGGSLIPHHVASGSVTPAELAAARTVFISRCGPLTEEGAGALARFIERGGCVAWFLDSDSDSANLQMVEKAMPPTKLPLVVGPLRKTANVDSASEQIATGDFKSRLLRMFRGPLRQDLGMLEFYDFHAASVANGGRVLLRFADETPAMAVAEHGLGSLVLMNFSVSEMSGNLPRQRIFPAWIQDLVKQANTGEPAPLAYVAGQLVQGEAWRADLRRQPLRSPGGKIIEPHQEPLGERVAISFPAEELGLYSLRDGGLKYACAVHGDPGQSDLRRADRTHLDAQVAGSRHATFAEGLKDYEMVAYGQPMLHWFLLGGLAVLAGESLLQMSLRRSAR